MRQRSIVKGAVFIPQHRERVQNCLNTLESALEAFGVPSEEDLEYSVESCEAFLFTLENCKSTLKEATDFFSEILGTFEDPSSFTTYEQASDAVGVILDYCHAYRSAVEEGAHIANDNVPLAETNCISEVRRNASSIANELAHVRFRRNG